MRLLSVRILPVVALGAAIAASIPAAAQTTDTHHKKIFGYTDESGVFHQAVHADPDAGGTPSTGTIMVTLNITLKTPLPKGGSVICNSSVDAQSINESTGTDTLYIEEAAKVATVSGATATCTVNIPYAWLIPPASSTVIDHLSGDYTVEMTTGTAVLPGLVRLTTGTFLSATKIPASGTISKFTMAVTM